VTESVVKAWIAGPEVLDLAASNAKPDENEGVFNLCNALVPPYDMRRLCAYVEQSTALRPNIDVYAKNIDGFGFRLEPTIDFEKSDDSVREAIRVALIGDKLAAGDYSPTVQREEIDSKIDMLPALMEIERVRLSRFFENATGELSFGEFRERLRYDYEATGNCYFEVIRDREGKPAQLVHLSAISMRLMRADPCPLEINEVRRVSALSLQRTVAKRRLRMYVQSLYGQFVAYFKELGDPRVISAATGRAYDSQLLLEKHEPRACPATEVVHLKVHSPLSAYGVPRWIGATLAILGSRAAEEVNATYFDNKAIPPMAILVSGGVLAKDARDRIENYVRDNIRGRDNFHKILVLEAEGTGGQAIQGSSAGARVRVEMRPLMEAQQQDALFQTYDANNIEKVGGQFRLPKILRGDMKDFNRATAEAALEYAEQQVFQPERAKFDHMVNKRLMGLLGSQYHQFVSNGVTPKDPPQLSQMVVQLTEAGVITPEEARQIAADVFGRDFEALDEEWTKLPLKITLAKLQGGGAPLPPPPDGEEKSLGKPPFSAVEAATQLMQLRMALTAARAQEADDVIEVPVEEFNKWVHPAG
jgi:PBSX family phage portal protein